MYFFFCLDTKEKDTKKKKSRLHFLRYSTSYFSGTKRTRYAQTAFCPRKILRSVLRCENEVGMPCGWKRWRLLLSAELPFLLLFPLLRCGLVAGCAALYGCEQAESVCHILGGVVLVVGLVVGIMPVPFGCARMLLLLCGTFHSGGLLLRVNTILPGEKVVEHVS